MLMEPVGLVGSLAPSPEQSPLSSSRVDEAEGSQSASFSRILRADAEGDGPETYALFSPDDVFASDRSVQLRRLDPSMADIQLEDVFQALVQPWQVDRKDVNGPHGNDWDPEIEADYWVSSDTGKVCFAAVPCHAWDSLATGQYYKEADAPSWAHFEGGENPAPGNDGGFHCCCVDTGRQDPGSEEWTLVAKLSDFGMVLGREAGLRVEFAALVRSDSEALIVSMGPHDECRSLFLVDKVAMPAGRVVLADPAELSSLGDGDSSPLDGPAVPSGVGAGYYPVVVSRGDSGGVCRITVVFHPERLSKVCRSFPPAAAAVSPPSSDDDVSLE